MNGRERGGGGGESACVKGLAARGSVTACATAAKREQLSLSKSEKIKTHGREEAVNFSPIYSSKKNNFTCGILHAAHLVILILR